jgi:hypothetical protein
MDELELRLLTQKFHEAMLDIYDVAGKTTGYWAGYFRREVKTKGGLPVARRLLRVSGTSDGFERLKKEHALNLSVEALVLRSEFSSLFSDEERAIARERLAAFGYTPAELGSAKTQVPAELAALLQRVDAAPTQEARWDLRNEIVAFGSAGREAMRGWLAIEHLPVLALSALEKLAASDPAAARVIDSYATTGGREHKLAIAALARIRTR